MLKKSIDKKTRRRYINISLLEYIRADGPQKLFRRARKAWRMFLKKKKKRHVGQTSPSNRWNYATCMLTFFFFFALACATGDTRVTLVQDFGKSCAWKGAAVKWNVGDYHRCPALLKVPLATARHAGGKRAQLMNSAI